MITYLGHLDWRLGTVSQVSSVMFLTVKPVVKSGIKTFVADSCTTKCKNIQQIGKSKFSNRLCNMLLPTFWKEERTLKVVEKRFGVCFC